MRGHAENKSYSNDEEIFQLLFPNSNDIVDSEDKVNLTYILYGGLENPHKTKNHNILYPVTKQELITLKNEFVATRNLETYAKKLIRYFKYQYSNEIDEYILQLIMMLTLTNDNNDKLKYWFFFNLISYEKENRVSAVEDLLNNCSQSILTFLEYLFSRKENSLLDKLKFYTFLFRILNLNLSFLKLDEFIKFIRKALMASADDVNQQYHERMIYIILKIKLLDMINACLDLIFLTLKKSEKNERKYCQMFENILATKKAYIFNQPQFQEALRNILRLLRPDREEYRRMVSLIISVSFQQMPTIQEIPQAILHILSECDSPIEVFGFISKMFTSRCCNHFLQDNLISNRINDILNQFKKLDDRDMYYQLLIQMSRPCHHKSSTEKFNIAFANHFVELKVFENETVGIRKMIYDNILKWPVDAKKQVKSLLKFDTQQQQTTTAQIPMREIQHNPLLASNSSAVQHSLTPVISGFSLFSSTSTQSSFEPFNLWLQTADLYMLKASESIVPSEKKFYLTSANLFFEKIFNFLKVRNLVSPQQLTLNYLNNKITLDNLTTKDQIKEFLNQAINFVKLSKQSLLLQDRIRFLTEASQYLIKIQDLLIEKELPEMPQIDSFNSNIKESISLLELTLAEQANLIKINFSPRNL